MRKVVVTIATLALGAVAGALFMQGDPEQARDERSAITAPRAEVRAPSPAISQRSTASSAVRAGTSAAPERKPIGSEVDLRLPELQRAAQAGNASAQFRLATHMTTCRLIRRFTPETLRTSTRRELKGMHEQCQYLYDQALDLIAESARLEREARENGSPEALARHALLEIPPFDEKGVKELQRTFEKLLPSKDPGVYAAIADYKQRSIDDPEALAWRMLACESDPTLTACGLLDGELNNFCLSHDCTDMTVSDYHLAKYPQAFDIARGRADEIRAKLEQNRYDEIDLSAKPIEPPAFVEEPSS